MGQGFGSLVYLRNTGSATAPAYLHAQAESPFGALGHEYSSMPELADLDADGDADAVVGGHGGTLAYFRNTGTPRAPRYAAVTGGESPFAGIDVGDGSAPALGDLDDDGDLDAVIGRKTNGILRFFRNTGTTSAPAFLEITGPGNPFMTQVGQYSAPELADLDGDGDLDAVVGLRAGTLNYFRNTGSPTAPAFLELTGTANPFTGVYFGQDGAPELVDLDQDGDLDLVLGTYLSGVRYFENTGSMLAPAFSELTGSANPFASIPTLRESSPAVADLDGDGDFDAVLGDWLPVLTYLLGRGDFYSDGFESGDTSAWSQTVP